MAILTPESKGFKIVQKRNKMRASSHHRTNELLERAEKLGLIDTYVDKNGRIRTKKEK